MRTLTVTDVGTVQTTANDADRATFDATPDRTFRAVVAALPDVGVEASVVDVAARRAGNPGFQRTRTLAGERLSALLECGSTLTGNRADNDRITMSLSVSVDPIETGKSQVRILLKASAKSMAGASTGAVDCGSSGRFEQLLRSAITKRLAAG